MVIHMKLRQARKILKLVERDDVDGYRESTLKKACQRVYGNHDEFFIALCESIGAVGRALIQRNAATALQILVEADESTWEGDNTLLNNYFEHRCPGWCKRRAPSK